MARKLDLLLISIHGLIRGHNLELGRDADTGGQTKYVVDLTRALAEHSDIARVDLVTRLVRDPNLSPDYAEPIEPLSDKARIIRIEAGPDEYQPKEKLWDYLDSFTDKLRDWLHSEQYKPSLIHSHYADAGYVGVRLANLLGIPLVYTGHSLGRDKRKRLLASGLSSSEIEHTYKISRRIEAEEETLANASLVITSTRNEIDEQYGLYNYYNPERMRVMPPGTDLHQFYPPADNEHIAFAHCLQPFLRDSNKPLILALSRPDERKNIATLIEAYGTSDALQNTANLLIVPGNRNDIRDLDPGAQNVLTDILLLIDAYNLYGKIALPKHHRADEVPEIYRLAAQSGGVFINPALTEPFGLTLLEAAASGLPLVATENGGPVDIINNCGNGLLIDPLDKEAIEAALLHYLCSPEAWRQAARNGLEGVKRHYSWQAHTDSYLDAIRKLPHTVTSIPTKAPLQLRYRKQTIVSDLDQNLIGDPHSLDALANLLKTHRKTIAFGIATGRRVDSALAVMRKHRIPPPDILISGLGTRIHYGANLIEDGFWSEHIDYQWNPNKVRRLLADLPGIKSQPKAEQSHFKVSYYYDHNLAPDIEEITALFHRHELNTNVQLSFGQFLDILPSRASKGQALRYVAEHLEIPLKQMLVAGGSGADEDMMRGNTLAVVVANRHHEELSQLTDQDSIYFAIKPHAAGILEAIEHYNFLALSAAVEAAHD